MPIESISINSKEMEKVVTFVGKLAKDMAFDADVESKNWVRARRKNAFFYSLVPARKGALVEKVEVDNLALLSVVPEEINEDKVVMYIHGGGFVTGSAFAKKNYCSLLAIESGYRVFSPDYALAPENKFPTGFDDCCRAFDFILEKYPNSKISLVGESAGGNLCLAVALKYKDSGRIANVSVHSPIVDFTGYVDRSINEKKDYIVKDGCIDPLIRMYVGEGDIFNPYISPILGSFKGFPPLFITADKNETLYADSRTLYNKCKKAGVNVNMIKIKGSFHAFGVTGSATPEAEVIVNKNIEFIKA